MSDNKHFEFTDETINVGSHVLHRIRALRDIPKHGVKKGDLGGFVESYDNLSDDAWVFDDAKVYGSAKVFENARVCGDAEVLGNAEVYEDAFVAGYASVFGHAQVFNDAQVIGNAQVYGDALVAGDAVLRGAAEVYENAKVFGSALVVGDAYISGDAEVKSLEDYAVFKNFWSSGRYFTWTRSNNMWRAGCFYGTGEELIAKAYRDSEKSGKCYEQIVNAVNNIKDILK